MAKTVMIVDDDPSILLVVEKFLKTKGLQVMCMRSAKLSTTAKSWLINKMVSA